MSIRGCATEFVPGPSPSLAPSMPAMSTSRAAAGMIFGWESQLQCEPAVGQALQRCLRLVRWCRTDSSLRSQRLSVRRCFANVGQGCNATFEFELLRGTILRGKPKNATPSLGHRGGVGDKIMTVVLLGSITEANTFMNDMFLEVVTPVGWLTTCLILLYIIAVGQLGYDH